MNNMEYYSVRVSCKPVETIRLPSNMTPVRRSQERSKAAVRHNVPITYVGIYPVIAKVDRRAFSNGLKAR